MEKTHKVYWCLNFQVNTFWEITKRQLEEKKAELRNKDREMEDAEERHQIEIKVCIIFLYIYLFKMFILFFYLVMHFIR